VTALLLRQFKVSIDHNDWDLVELEVGDNDLEDWVVGKDNN
jgi:hypothetical protein